MNLPRSPRRSRITWLAAVLLSGAAPGLAQSFNVDVGPASTGQPSAAYGAAGNQPGFWNPIEAGNPNVSHPVKDLSGAATAVTARYTFIGNGAGNFHFDAPLTTGDDDLLMDDCMDIGSGTSISNWTFDNLVPGTVYDVYTYAWAPDNPWSYRTKVSCFIASNPVDQILGGDVWPGQHELALTVARHRVTVPADGSVQVLCSPSIQFATLNGFQFVEWDGGCLLPRVYCTAKANSLGCASLLSYAGVPSATDGSGFEISFQPVAGKNLGILIYTTQGELNPPITGPFGSLCISASGLFRLPAQNSGGTSQTTCDGRYAVDFNAWFATATNDPNLVPGAQVNAQFWYRDPPNPGLANFSNAIEFAMCP